MKKLISLVLVLGMAMPIQAKVLIGRVDIQKIITTIKQGVAVQEKLKQEFDKKQKVLTAEEEKIKKLRDDYEKQSAVLSDQAKDNKQKDIQERFMKLQQQTMQYQKEIQALEKKFKNPILEKVKEIVEDVSKKAGVDMTFEASMAPIVYAKEEKDLTDEIIAIYDKKYPK